MVSNNNQPATRIMLRAPVILLVVAASAIPVELRPLGGVTLDFKIFASDFAANILAYVLVGIVLGGLGPLRAVCAAALLSTLAETGQFVMMHRDPSAIDVAANVIGAILGAIVSAHWKIRSPGIRISRWKALTAAALSCVLVARVWARSGDPVNARGTTSPGTLEACWKLDESHGRTALDSSGHGLHGRFSKEPKRVAGVIGGAVTLDGAKDYIDFGHSTAFRLAGSMTITAWINSSSFPVDDAAIVSQLDQDRGYQLDTTVDKGPRTIGFKLTNACGNLMARYGATALVVDTWYHVAGVYDADAQTLDVYLNGQPDNGFLLGSVSSRQRSSRGNVYVGRRSDLEEYDFAGAIDDVRIYSLALTKAEIAEVMHGTVIHDRAIRRDTESGVDSSRGVRRPGEPDVRCAGRSDPADAETPGAAAALGVLVAVACVGLWPSVGSLLCVVISFAAGLLLIPATAPHLPPLSLWTLPLLSLAGGASVVVSLRPSRLKRASQQAG